MAIEIAPWTPELAERHKQAFMIHLNSTWVKSKDAGYIILGENLLNSQKIVIDTVFEGLGRDIHSFKFLKSRQLGVSTITRAISLYWNGIFEMTSALLFDTTAHLDEARLELLDMLQKFPPEYEFPRKERDNRYSLTLKGGSRINLLSAGAGKTKSSGGLGSGSGLTMVHRSELCGYGDPEALENFRHTLSRFNPNRLFIDESTARGYNMWHDIWLEGKDDPECICVFIGWWAHQYQQIPREHPDFARFTASPLTDDERNKIRTVWEEYGHEITPEQLAWIRKEMRGSDDDDDVRTDDPTRIQNQPWTEAEAWQQTGATFFSSEVLTDQTNKNASGKFAAYSFMPGFDFVDMTVVPTKHWRHGQLKVWEEPVEDSVYVVSCDPAYGHSDKSDRSAIQVLRCFSDGLDQVAEYAWPLINTQQLAWVVAAIEGWYAGQTSLVYRIVEINGPGEATWRELLQLKQKIATGYFGSQLADRGLLSIQANVKNYFYTRSDSQHPGHVWQFKALALDTPLPTPDGWTTMENVEAGDWLLDEKGQPCQVLVATEIMHGQPCREVRFDDGTSIIADEGHLWNVQGTSAPTDKGPEIISTAEIKPMKHGVWVAEPLQLPERELPIHPYVLGVWLGNGDASGGLIHHHQKDIDEVSGYLIECGESLSGRFDNTDNKSARVNILGLKTRLRDANLLSNKHIPPEYLRASFDQRLALMHGLMDTDGSIVASNGRQCLFATSSPEIATGFSDLVRGLGFKCKFLIKYPVLEYRGKMVQCKPAYQFRFTGYPELPVFRLKRKVERQAWDGIIKPRVSKMHKIVSTDEVPSVPVKCIQVDSPSHLYLAGHGMIPTHNTQSQLKVAIMERLRDVTSSGLLRIRSMATLEEMRAIAREGDSIAAEGSGKDDRVVSLAMGVRCWEERARRNLMQTRRTREADIARRRVSMVDQIKLYNDNQLSTFLAGKSAARAAAMRAAMRQRRWGGR